MTYEVQFQIGAVQHTVRGPDPDGVLTLVQRLQEPVGSKPSNAQSRSVFETLWLRATKDLEGAMALVQNNSEFFGARCGDDKIKVIGEFFVKWAAEKLQATPWYPDDSGDWVEGHPRDLPPTTRIADWLFDYERDNKRYVPAPAAHPASDIYADHKVVAYKVAKP